ncbi:unnamed protein product [Cyprideis torosa]|uniref:4-hydroxybenzoate polyprenyltransferase, mitochondrial n=1 Tax=Cyprideis torosa TaxID=163714 RepID=A0A7R8W6A2_9CRUS|nr:unnamed protein product [Cyprideis torosa]CAG0883863.1 unnamed protein product [Cyprideis torosa]
MIVRYLFYKRGTLRLANPTDSFRFGGLLAVHSSVNAEPTRRWVGTHEDQSWIEKTVASAPLRLQPYLRLSRVHTPTGTWLLFYPGAWSICLAGDPVPSISTLALFLFGSLVMRGAGCTINDFWDRDFDKKISRTSTRPIANGELTRFQAFQWLGVQLCIGLMILLCLNWQCVAIGATSVALVVLYPLAKRFMNYPQTVLALTINWGALLGYTQVIGHFAPEIVLPLYLGGAAWTMYYDTVYAHQDKQGDSLLGLGSTALAFGQNTKPWLIGFSSTMLVSLALAGHGAGMSMPYFATLGVAGLVMARQIQRVDLDNAKDCFDVFAQQKYIGILIMTGAIAGCFWNAS